MWHMVRQTTAFIVTACFMSGIGAAELQPAPAPLADASPTSLLAAWDYAQQQDASYLKALAERDAGAEDAIIGRAQLLPQISASGSLGRARTETERLTALGAQSSEERYDTEAWALQLRQAIFRPRAMIGYQQGKVAARLADAKWQSARQGLIRRLVEQAAAIAEAEARLRTAQLARATQRQLSVVASRQLQAGEATRSEEARARSALMAAVRDVDEQRVALAEARQGWLELVGHRPFPFQIRPALIDLLTVPGDGDMETLMAVATRDNPALRAARHEIESARYDVRRAQGDRLPNIDLVASRTYNDSDTDNTIGSAFDTQRIVLQASIPLFTGGQISAVIRQSRAMERAAEFALKELLARARISLSRDIVRFEQARSALTAAESALEAANTEYRQAELGRIAGTSTLAELVRAERAQSEASRDQTIAVIALLRAWLSVQDVLGGLDARTLDALDKYLVTAL